MTKPIRAMAIGAAALSLCAAGGALAQSAESEVHGMIAIGGGAAPDYEGSEDYAAVPFGLVHLTYRNVSLEIEGLEGRVAFSPIEGFELGPALRLRGGRDDDVENVAVSALPEIDDAVEAGGFVRYGAPVGFARGDEASVQLDVLADVSDTHSGVVGTLSGGYGFQATERLRLTTTLSTTVVSDDYADTYFSVTPAGAGLSGLSAFEADGGLLDVGLGLTASYQFDDHWGAFATGSARQLLGDAADSPIVDDEGSATQFFLGAGLGYSF